MMFILRSADGAPMRHGLRIAVTRKTPDVVPDASGKIDYFCIGEAVDMAALREVGCDIIELRDGWYADDSGGGVAIWGQGRYWEIRDAPLHVKEAGGFSRAPDTATAEGGEPIDVRNAIFGV